MPWTTNDVDKHKKGLNPKQKSQWVATANSALARCKAGKVKPKGGESCDAYAIKVANAAVSSGRGYVVQPEPIRAVEGKPGRYRTYAVRFNGPNDKDLYGTWFDQRTNYHLDYYEKWPWLYHHGRNMDYRGVKVGVWDTRGIDDVGVFVEGEITAHGAYREAVEALVAERALFPSSQALHSMVEVEESGHVLSWPIAEVSSTISPADFKAGGISEVAMRAVEVLEGQETKEDYTMGWKDAFKTFIDGLPDTPGAKTGTEGTEGTEGDPPSGGKGTTQVDPVEVARAVVAELNLEPVIRAVGAIDVAIRDLSDRMTTVETVVAGLAASEPERIKSALAGSDWYKSLFVASRQAPPENPPDGGTPPPGSTEGGLQEGETVMGRLATQ